MDAAGRSVRRLAAPVGSLARLALPDVCGGCGRLGTRWCRDCARQTAIACPSPRIVAGRAGSACGPGGVVLAAGVYEGALRSAILEFKDGGRRDLVGILAPLMRSVLLGAVPRAGQGALFVVPAPSSPRARRERGDVPLHLLVREALVGLEAVATSHLVWAPVLTHTRTVADQAGLSRDGRAANLRGAVVAGDVVAGREVVVADDVVTTGATARECVRAVRAAGGRPVAVVAVAATLQRDGGDSA